MVPMGSSTSSRLPTKPTPSIIQAAPTVYSALPVTVAHKKPDYQAQRQARMVSASFLYIQIVLFRKDLCGFMWGRGVF